MIDEEFLNGFLKFIETKKPKNESPKTKQVMQTLKGIDEEQDPIKKQFLKQSKEGRGYGRASQNHDSALVYPSVLLRRMIDYIIWPGSNYRLEGNKGMLELCGVHTSVREAIPADIAQLIDNAKSELIEKIFSYQLQQPLEYMKEDDFMDTARLHLNDTYEDKRREVMGVIGNNLALKKADGQIYEPYAELVLATLLLEKGIEAKIIHEFFLIGGQPTENIGEDGGLIGYQMLTDKGRKSILITPPGVDMNGKSSEEILNILTSPLRQTMYEQQVLVEPMVMPQKVWEQIRNGGEKPHKFNGFYQVHTSS